ncbi:coiled-coil and C2 domain-containing protein 1A-like [Oncorhynchus keta]|uniref:coiled-coil and C2 domain-containing protein 1A-like n=1 Tax=Oncorhynchus keta TaxID=8018 RepID=UPI00227C063E|nr:coiled-coil and C2 domain-containing protein 1A-like [Oncorhynchus keta]
MTRSVDKVLSMSHSRNPPPRGQGAARAKQMGLLLDLSPDGGGNEKELEAELLALMGGGGSQGKKGTGKAPVPMADIERMAALCMKDLDEDDDDGDDDLEDDDDLLAELNEVLEDDDDEEVQKPATTPSSNSTPAPPPALLVVQPGWRPAWLNALTCTRQPSPMLMQRGDQQGSQIRPRIEDVAVHDDVSQERKTNQRRGNPASCLHRWKACPSPVQQPKPIKERGLPTPVLTPSPFTNQKPLREAPPVAPPPKPRLLVPLRNTLPLPRIHLLSPPSPPFNQTHGTQS